MMNRPITLIILLLAFYPSFLFAQEPTDTTGDYAKYISEVDTTTLGSNLSLEAVAEVFRTSKDLEQFEKRLNDEDEGVNNLDLNNDGETDYLRVVDYVDGSVHVVVIQAVIGKDQYQDVASIDVVQDGDKVTLQIVGDEKIYGTDYYLKPEKQEEVKDYPAVQVMFVVGYSPYYSPYHWGYYPPYYRPWPPYPPYRYHRNCYHRYPPHYRYPSHYNRNPHANNVYNKNRKTAPINQPNKPGGSRPSQQPAQRPSTQPSQKPSQQPSTRPSQSPSTTPSQKPSQQPNTRPSQSPSTTPSKKPSQSPSTRPSQSPSATPSKKPSQTPSTRPSQSPSATPSKKPSQTPSAKPSQRTRTQPSKQSTPRTQGRTTRSPGRR